MTRYKKMEFVTSVASIDKLVETPLPQIAIAGKSNVGKSSFINMIADHKKLAKISSMPGRTRLLNYYNVEDRFFIVDLPGYGFAKAPKEEKQKWGELIEGYLQSNRNIKRIILLLDCRHEPTVDDLLMINYMHHYTIPFTIAFTKVDKLTKNQLAQSKKKILAKIKMTENDVYFTSSETKQGRDGIMQLFEHILQIEIEIDTI